MILEKIKEELSIHVPSVKEIHDQDMKMSTGRFHSLMLWRKNTRALQKNGAGSGCFQLKNCPLIHEPGK